MAHVVAFCLLYRENSPAFIEEQKLCLGGEKKNYCVLLFAHNLDMNVPRWCQEVSGINTDLLHHCIKVRDYLLVTRVLLGDT